MLALVKTCSQLIGIEEEMRLVEAISGTAQT
jgi:hypothetical protein